MSTKQKRTLKMHPKLLLDVIGRQAGTLDKAMLEGIMNAIEAMNALKMNGGQCHEEKIYVTYEKTETSGTIVIKDFGKGITTEEEIENFFETFGTPHDENEHKIYAQFRMGRGQMFNFGKNTWRTGTFELVVDVMNNGLDWELKNDLPYVDGCHITIECLKEATKNQVEFVDVPIIFNGEKINTPASECNWDFEDDFAYYLFNIGDKLKVYNLGVYVRERWETKGIIVSKQQLKLNFPRNDVMADCPIFYHITDVVRKNVVNKAEKKTYNRLSENERRAILKNVRDGVQKFQEIKGSRILQTAQDKYISFLMFLNNKQPWTIARVGDRMADKAIQMGSHTVFAREMLDAMNYSGEDKDFFGWLIRTLIDSNVTETEDGYLNTEFDYYLKERKNELLNKSKSFETLSKVTSETRRSIKYIPTNKLTRVEKRVLSVLDDFQCWDNRQFRFGISNGSAAWTDGHSYITIDREWFKRLRLSWDCDIARLFGILAHELAHDDDTSMTDIHGEDFYENYHDITTRNCDNPFTCTLKFKESMRYALRAERNEQEKQRQKEQLEEKARRLGIGGKEKIASCEQ
jgi:hypothetical protein